MGMVKRLCPNSLHQFWQSLIRFCARLIRNVAQDPVPAGLALLGRNSFALALPILKGFEMLERATVLGRVGAGFVARSHPLPNSASKIPIVQSTFGNKYVSKRRGGLPLHGAQAAAHSSRITVWWESVYRD
jgi:hypothetical protein